MGAKMFLIAILTLCISLQLPDLTSAAWACDETYSMAAVQTSYLNNPNYPNNYASGSSCMYTIIAPANSVIEVTCQLNVPSTTSCSSERLYIEREGEKSLTRAEYFCGSGTVTKTSMFNSITIAYSSSPYTSSSGTFACTVRTYKVACDCGWSVNTPRIVGGTTAGVNEFTAMAGLVDVAGSKIFCGGAIIHERYILTAAHCFSSYTNPANIGILVGDHDINVGTDTVYSKLYKAQSIIKHEYYNTVSKVNDIALLVTTSNIIWYRGVAPACLPFKYLIDFAGYSLPVAGWGSSDYGSPATNLLKKVYLDVLTNSYCSTKIAGIQYSQLCTYTMYKDTCQYDSGGSFYWTYGGRVYSVAIVSYGVGCASTDPSVNTRVTSFLTWIENKIGANTLCKV